VKVKIVGLGIRRSGTSTKETIGKDGKPEKRSYDIQEMYYVGERGAVGIDGRKAGQVLINRATEGYVVPDVAVGDICEIDLEKDFRGNDNLSYLEVLAKPATAKA
jgi:hypothetical protein